MATVRPQGAVSLPPGAFLRLESRYMQKSFNRMLPALWLAGALTLPRAGAALEVTIDNLTEAEVTMAFSYLEPRNDTWVVEGWFNVQPHQKGLVSLPTDNELYYIYAEFSNGKRIEGGEGAVTLPISYRSFYLQQDQVPQGSMKEVSFLRARSSGGKATVKIQ